jgi:hypothetical protein
MARRAAIGLLKRIEVSSLKHLPSALQVPSPERVGTLRYAARRFLAREAGLRRAAVLRAGFFALRAEDFFFIFVAIGYLSL